MSARDRNDEQTLGQLARRSARSPRSVLGTAATGQVLAVLFMDPGEAERARHDLIGRGVPEGDLRLYGAEETLRIMSRRQEERSILAKGFDALVADHPARNAM